MFRNIFFPTSVRLTRNWIATGNPRNPLVCVWSRPGTQRVQASTATGDEGRLPLCA